MYDSVKKGETGGPGLSGGIFAVKIKVEQEIECLPCPFCGSLDLECRRAAVLIQKKTQALNMIHCKGCNCDGPIEDSFSLKWNIRYGTATPAYITCVTRSSSSSGQVVGSFLEWQQRGYDSKEFSIEDDIR